MPIKENYEKALRRTVESTPYYRLLDIRLEQIDLAWSRFRMTVRKELTQAEGLVHGGAIVSLADTAGSFALLTMVAKGERVATVEIKMNYLSSVQQGDVLGEARILHKGEWLAVADIGVTNEDGRLVGKGQGTYAILKPFDADENKTFPNTILWDQ